jgi:hypothetical protein
MPVYTIETTYDLPVYRQRSYSADTLAAACELALQDDDWECASNSYDGASPTYVTGAWRGRGTAYRHGHDLPIPAEHAGPVALVAIVQEALTAWAEQFDGTAAELHVSGADLVDWFASWRTRARAALVAAGVALTLAACAGPSVVVMRNPRTGEVRQCGNPTGISMIADTYAAKGCADGYQAAGWERMN